MAPEALVALGAEVLADSLGDYLRAWWKRIRGGESGAIPIIIGLIVICIFFEVQSSAFLTATNIVNLFVQAAFIILLGMAELYALDPQRDRPLRRLRRRRGRRHRAGADQVTGRLALVGRPDRGHGRLRRHRRLPGRDHHQAEDPLVRGDAGRIAGWQGVLIYVFDVDKGAVGGVISIPNGVLDDLVSGNMTPAAGWIVLVVGVGLYALTTVLTHGPAALAGPERRRRSASRSPPSAPSPLRASSSSASAT